MDKSEEIKRIRESTGLNRRAFCERYNIPYRTVTEWERDGRRAPDYVVRLLDYYVRMHNLTIERSGDMEKNNQLRAEEYENELTGYKTGDEVGMVAEEMVGYSTTDGSSAMDLSSNADKTLEDYLALPDDERVEMIDGVFYDMAAPTTVHQRISFLLGMKLENFIIKNKGACTSFVAPVDVQLDCDDKTIVEPDVFVVCDRNKITKPRVVGAPDFVAEVLSPSNWYHYTVRKLLKYKNAGVREYWIVMPENRKILVYFFEKSPDPVEYSFEDEIPVGIWDGKCKVDFKEIFESIKDFI